MIFYAISSVQSGACGITCTWRPPKPATCAVYSGTVCLPVPRDVQPHSPHIYHPRPSCGCTPLSLAWAWYRLSSPDPTTCGCTHFTPARGPTIQIHRPSQTHSKVAISTRHQGVHHMHSELYRTSLEGVQPCLRWERRWARDRVHGTTPLSIVHVGVPLRPLSLWHCHPLPLFGRADEAMCLQCLVADQARSSDDIGLRSCRAVLALWTPRPRSLPLGLQRATAIGAASFSHGTDGCIAAQPSVSIAAIDASLS